MNNSKKINLNALLFCLICLLLTVDMFTSAFLKISKYENLFRYATVVIMIALFILNRNITTSDILIVILIMLILIQNSEVSTNLAYLLLLSLSSKYVDNRSLYIGVNILNIIIVVAVIFCLSFDIVDNVVIYTRNRNTLGFVHPNYVGLLCYSIVASYLLLKKELSHIETVLLAIFTISIFAITDSRTGCYGAIALLITNYFFRYCKQEYKKPVAILCLLIVFALPFFIRLPIFEGETINSLLSKRPIRYQAYINSCTIKQLLIGGAESTTDCFYINVLYGCGIFIYIIFELMFLLSIKEKANSNKDVELSFILTTLLIGTMESSLMRPEMLFVIIFWKLIVEEIDY